MDPYHFQPIPGLWRFHVMYLLVTVAMGWSFFPYATALSLLLVAASCVAGIICSRLQWFMASHILALAIGLGTPVVIFAGLRWYYTVLMFLVLLAAIFVKRKSLF